MRERSVPERAKAAPSKRASATSGEPATDGRSRWLWFNAPTNDQDRRPELTRERVVAEALTVIAPHRPALGGRPTTTTIRPREEARQAVGNNT